MDRPFDLSLRSRLLLLVLLGVLVPLGLMGLFASNSARRAGIELVRDRLREALAETVDEFGRQWIQRRSLLLDLADARPVVNLLEGRASWTDSIPEPSRGEVARLWSDASGFLVSLTLRDTENIVVGRLPEALGMDLSVSDVQGGTVDYALPVLERLSGREMGSMTVRIRVDGLLPPGFLALGVAGSIPAVFDDRTGAPLGLLSIDGTLFSRRRFVWRGEEWVAEDRVLEDPPLRFALAAPIDPVTAPFDRAARRGALAILLAVALSFALVSVFARRLTRPLDRLAGAAHALASGNLRTHVEESGPPGIRETARAFNAMSETLEHTLEELSRKEAIAAVGEFAADLAHEVRNPLTAIRTDLQRAQRKLDADPAAALELVDRAMAAVDLLNATVRDSLSVARSGNVTPVASDLREPLKAAVDATEPQRAGKRCTLRYAPPPEPIPVFCDPDAVRRLALNLLLNAVEAVDPGTALGIRTHRKPGDGWVTVEFWDHGPGIPEGTREKIFDPFHTTKEGGTGLGLAIARRIARAHGSDLIVEVTPGETVFRFRLRADPT